MKLGDMQARGVQFRLEGKRPRVRRSGSLELERGSVGAPQVQMRDGLAAVDGRGTL